MRIESDSGKILSHKRYNFVCLRYACGNIKGIRVAFGGEIRGDGGKGICKHICTNTIQVIIWMICVMVYHNIFKCILCAKKNKSRCCE